MDILSWVRWRNCGVAAMVLWFLAPFGLAQQKAQIFQATAHGQGDQQGMAIGLTLVIESYSTAEDQASAWDAFDKAGKQGLASELTTMPSRGHLSFAGVGEYEIAYAREFALEKGRKLRVVARRPLRFGENPSPGTTSNFKLSALELDFAKDGSKTGIFLPECELGADREKGVQIMTFLSPWRLDSITETAGK